MTEPTLSPKFEHVLDDFVRRFSLTLAMLARIEQLERENDLTEQQTARVMRDCMPPA